MALDATLDASREDGDVTFTLHVANAGQSALDLTFPSGQVADVAVAEAASGESVWRWSDDRLFTQLVETRTLAPGESIEETFTWREPPPGEYLAVASLAADRDVEARTSVTV